MDNAAVALAQIVEQYKEDKYPEARRYVVGLNSGWEERKAAKVAAREAATDAD